MRLHSRITGASSLFLMFAAAPPEPLRRDGACWTKYNGCMYAAIVSSSNNHEVDRHDAGRKETDKQATRLNESQKGNTRERGKVH